MGRREFLRPSSTLLAQAEHCESLILLLAPLWTPSWWPLFPNLEQPQLLLGTAELVTEIASRPSHMMLFPFPCTPFAFPLAS